jgi:hypothetical protein
MLFLARAKLLRLAKLAINNRELPWVVSAELGMAVLGWAFSQYSSVLLCRASARLQPLFKMIKELFRCFIFLVFGPGLGLLTLVVIGRGSARDLGLDTSVIVLFMFYLNGLVPALITAAFDSYLDCKRATGIALWLGTGCFGYAAAYVNILGPLLLFQPKWGLVGAIPAAICSAITDLTLTLTKGSLRA